MSRTRLLLVGLVAALCAPRGVSAQDRPHPRAEVPHFDFRPDGVWRRQARQIRANRARMLARRQFGPLNAPLVSGAGAPLAPAAPAGSAAAVSGVLRVPALLFKYRDTPANQLHTAAQYDQILFTSTPPAGRPYTYRSFYEQMSNGLLSIEGKTYGYVTLDSNEAKYTGDTSSACKENNPFGVSNCNGVWSSLATSAMQAGLRQALQQIDAQVDWNLYDSDGDGFVDLVLFLPVTRGGECGPPPARGTPNKHLWAHRFFLPFAYQTHSVTSHGVRVKVSDYILQSAVGGATACDSTQIMPIGTVAHETGHGFGLPDLYDVADSSEGIGQWGLMGSGNFTTPLSPSRMEAWSLSQLGWVTLRPLGAAGTYTLGAAPQSDTAFYVRVLGANPRGEYFLLENRQAVQSDSALIRINCQVSRLPPTCPGGLLVWHIDSTQVVNGGFGNTVNSGPIHGVELVQADGLGNLDVAFTSQNSNRGDAGDPYPGSARNPALSATTMPAARRNSDGRPAGIVVDQIQQLGDGVMSLQLSLPVTLVRAVDTAATVVVAGVRYNVYRDVLDQGTVIAVGIDSVQLTAGGRTQQTFVSWSDGLPRNHDVTVGATPDTVIATLSRVHQLVYSATTGGSVTPANAADTSGSFLVEGTAVTLTAAAGSTPFLSWAGDTASTSAQLRLPMGRPYTVRAVFLAPVPTTAVVSQLLAGTGLTTGQQADLDQLGNANGRFDLGDFLAWVNATGAPLTTEQRALVAAARPQGGRR